MRFLDTIQFQIPKQIKYANSESSPFNSDEIPFHMHITKEFHNFLEMIPQILLAIILQTLLLQTNLLLQILYLLPFEYVFLFECSKLCLTNFMNSPILVSKLHIIHCLNITRFHFLKNGSPFSYMTVLNVNVINTSK